MSPGGIGRILGEVMLRDSDKGLELRVKLSGLTPGEHGIHIHENVSCEPREKEGKMEAAGSTGPHYDPKGTGIHAGPHGAGHRGDLPQILAAVDGSSESVITASNVKLSEILNRAIVIHAGSDNYADAPNPLGGGGARVACGIIRKHSSIQGCETK